MNTSGCVRLLGESAIRTATPQVSASVPPSVLFVDAHRRGESSGAEKEDRSLDAAQPRRTASGFEDTCQNRYSKMSVIRQLSRFIRLSSDLRVTFCSPISMR
jgi:hypothetical protein